MKRLALILVLVAAGCQTATMPGSVYRQTGRIADLLAEPTFDVGGDPNESVFYSFRVPHYDADGHGLYDIPFVASQQMFFAPVWLCTAGYRLVGGDSYFGGPRPGMGGPAGRGGQSMDWLRGLGAYGFAIPGVGFYWMATGTVTVLDAGFHDVPVIVIGRPLRWVGEQLARAGL
ncbi:MAG: hypothetical protein N3D11_09105 [Candidatus Sumerlaeia bacterium]|nr:hypothetical protein [Candidatus Sumerlaeia bacterium]